MGRWGYDKADVVSPFDSDRIKGDTSSSIEDKNAAFRTIMKRYEDGRDSAAQTRETLEMLGLMED